MMILPKCPFTKNNMGSGMVRVKALNADIVSYLYTLPYAITYDNGKRVAVVDLINLPTVGEKSFWKKFLGEHYGVLLYILRAQDRYKSSTVLRAFVDYYFIDAILRKVSYLPEYEKFYMLEEENEHGLIKKDVWIAHINHLYEIRDYAKSVLQSYNLQGGLQKIVNTMRKPKRDMDNARFKKALNDLVTNNPEVLAEILKFIPFKQLFRAVDIKEIGYCAVETKKFLVRKLNDWRMFNPSIDFSIREHVYVVHDKLEDALDVFPVIRHMYDTEIVYSLADAYFAKAVQKFIEKCIEDLNGLIKSLDSVSSTLKS